MERLYILYYFFVFKILFDCINDGFCVSYLDFGIVSANDVHILIIGFVPYFEGFANHLGYFFIENFCFDVTQTKFAYNSAVFLGVVFVKRQNSSQSMKYSVICAVYCGSEIFSAPNCFLQRYNLLSLFPADISTNLLPVG